MLVLTQFCLGSVSLLCIKIQWCQFHVFSDWFSIEHLGIILGTDILKSFFFSLVFLIFSSCCRDFLKQAADKKAEKLPVSASQVVALCHCQLYALSCLCQENADKFIGVLEGYNWRHFILCSLLLISWFRN